ncbi:hypothetical protein AMAG_17166 [Allomyces macrogynus ATCC 38327]|uniref:Uncharacterized protein n=1 Tax=Allomyces macrogynus (strain ATCC 38327) TaxID=578462 RepID=A0A0L0TEC2_ALLM3|nr:hypothetical protein AMAG_17166 [Allomyces macrogynus ATCC 38327]|eukprot:KNE72934.1 hypothetical protein AMAG_17166 [Allomyces macrogynus ATCC 38327]
MIEQGVPAVVWARVGEVVSAATCVMVGSGLVGKVAAARVVAAVAREDVAVLVPHDALVVAMMRGAAVTGGGEHARVAVHDLQASVAAVVTRLLERDVNRVDKWGAAVAEFLAACAEVGEEVAHLACVVAAVRSDVLEGAVREHRVEWVKVAAGRLRESRTMVQLLAHIVAVWERDGVPENDDDGPVHADVTAIARAVTARVETTSDLAERDVLYYTLASLVRLAPTHVDTTRIARVVVAHLAPPVTSSTSPASPSAHLVRLLAAVAAAPGTASALHTPAVSRWIRHAIRYPPPTGTSDPLPSVLVQIVRSDTDAAAFLVSRTTTTVGGDRLTLIEALVGTCIARPRPALVTCVKSTARFASVARALFARPRPWIVELVRAVDAAGRAVARGGGGAREALGMLCEVVEVWTACGDPISQSSSTFSASRTFHQAPTANRPAHVSAPCASACAPTKLAVATARRGPPASCSISRPGRERGK